jgi:hypothetical protein
MDINSSGTGGAEDAIVKGVKDESEVADDTGLNNSVGLDDSSQQQLNKKGKKVGGSSGQIATKEHNATDDTTGAAITDSTSGNKNSKSMLIREGGHDENGKRIRFDKYGNQITTI